MAMRRLTARRLYRTPDALPRRRNRLSTTGGRCDEPARAAQKTPLALRFAVLARCGPRIAGIRRADAAHDPHRQAPARQCERWLRRQASRTRRRAPARAIGLPHLTS